MERLAAVTVGDQVFLQEGGEECGAVRDKRGNYIVIYVENAGDFEIEFSAIKRVHDGKVILDGNRITPKLLHAIDHAHDKEERSEFEPN